jgi:hypothetical protein
MSGFRCEVTKAEYTARILISFAQRLFYLTGVTTMIRYSSYGLRIQFSQLLSAERNLDRLEAGYRELQILRKRVRKAEMAVAKRGSIRKAKKNSSK